MQQGSKEAFAEVYDRFWRSLFSYASKRLTITQDAEEVVQEVFVSLWVRREYLNIVSSLDVYLQAAVRYKVYNKYREYLNRRETYKIPGLEEGYTDNHVYGPVAGRIEYRELETRLNNAVNALPEKCREVFILSREKRLSNKTIAERLGISVNTVEKHIGKALRILRIEFRDEYMVVFLLLGATSS